MYSKKLIIGMFCIFLAGCAGAGTGVGAVNPSNLQSVYNSTKVEHDAYKNETQVRGPLIFVDGFVLNDGYSAFITKKADGSKFVGMFFAVKLKDWAHLEAAYSGGKKYPLGKINQKVDSCGAAGCRMTETVGLNLTMSQLRQLSKGDAFNVKLVGATGSRAFSIPSAYFQALLKKAEETKP